MNQKLFNEIDRLGISSLAKLRMYRTIHILSNKLLRTQINENIAFIPCNELYGHEYWIKRYADWNKPIYGLIEHGLYFGNNHQKVGNAIEYDIKEILTFGEYRETILKESFKDSNIIKIGPRIAYAETDIDYKNEIDLQLRGNRRALTIFPAHSITSLKSVYNINELMENAAQLCNRLNLDNIIVSLPYGDLENGLDKEFYKENCIVVSAGKNPVKFLPRLRAIIEESTVTLANSLGTNLGYCVYLGKQQILIPQKIEYEGTDRALEIEKDNKGSQYAYYYQKETELFANVFNEKSDENITKEQQELCNKFWGIDQVKKPEEMHDILDALYRRYLISK